MMVWLKFYHFLREAPSVVVETSFSEVSFLKIWVFWWGAGNRRAVIFVYRAMGTLRAKNFGPSSAITCKGSVFSLFR